MTDEEHASTIRAKIAEINDALRQAARAGLVVEVMVGSEPEEHGRFPTPARVACEVHRPL